MTHRSGALVVKKNKKGIDLNSILQFSNLLFLILTWWSFIVNGINEYVNFTTICLGTLLSVEIFIFLLIEKKRRDPFVIILCLQLVFYYVLRILTLSIYHFSVVFLRYPFGPANLNYAIIFIMVANLAIFAGLYMNKATFISTPLKSDITPRKSYLVYILLIFAYLVTFPQLIGLGALAEVIALLTSIFLNILTIMFMIIIYFILYRKKITANARIIIICGLLGYIILATLTGSRSGIVTVSYLVIFAFLIIHGSIKIKKKYLAMIVLTIPILVLFFTLATYLRGRVEDRSSISSETLSTLKEFDLQETFKDNSELILAPIFDRIGFLDYGAEIIANNKKYSGVFNFRYYARSFVDNVLTPGFDVFDTPLTANALTFIYNDLGPPKKSKEKDSYQSDEFTLYGEAYVLLGKWFSIVPIFFISFAFKRLYVKMNDKYEFRLYAKRGIILFIFYSLLNSFGFDWILFGCVGIIITYFIFKHFFVFGKPNMSNIDVANYKQ